MLFNDVYFGAFKGYLACSLVNKSMLPRQGRGLSFREHQAGGLFHWLSSPSKHTGPWLQGHEIWKDVRGIDCMDYTWTGLQISEPQSPRPETAVLSMFILHTHRSITIHIALVLWVLDGVALCRDVYMQINSHGCRHREINCQLLYYAVPIQ